MVTKGRELKNKKLKAPNMNKHEITHRRQAIFDAIASDEFGIFRELVLISPNCN